jgi:hypothetical protein
LVAVPPRRWISVTATVICLTAFSIWLVLQLSQGDLDRGDKLASIVSMSVAVVTLPLSVFAIVVTLRQGQPAKAMLTLAERLDEMAEALAIAVRSQWEAEEQVRRVHDPFPLPARWTTAREHLMDQWQNIHGDPGRRDPLSLDGHGDHIVDTFNVVPSGRLVVLGRAGAGKTILTSRFVLTMLSFRPVPVPVIFSLGSWDPTASPLRDWLVNQLITTYPVLAERDSSDATVAAQLLTTGRIMPVLDGFDEISEGLRVDAIKAINAGLRPGDRLLLTSRLEEYAAAVRTGDVLTAAAVVRLADLTVADLATYLPLTTRKVHNGRNKWEPVLDALRAGPSPLSEVLTTPLMVALARAIYSDTDADPTELLDVTSAIELEERLLAGFIPAVYPGNPAAGRWLAFLAAHLHRLDTYDLAWWRVVRAAPRLVVGLVAGAVFTLMTWLPLVIPSILGTWTADLRTVWLAASLGCGLLMGAIGGVVIGQRRGVRRTPAATRLQIRGRMRMVGRELAGGLRSWRSLAWMVAWVGGGLIFGLADAVGLESPGAVPIGLVLGFVNGIWAGFLGLSGRALGAVVDPTETVSPPELLRIDRINALREGLLYGVGVASVLWLTVWPAFEPASGLPFGQVFGHGGWLLSWLVTVACVAVFWMLFVAVWGPWLIARTWLALTGRLPWPVMAFLADAHRRGVLRQAGGVYQFRHARLRDHLASR